MTENTVVGNDISHTAMVKFDTPATSTKEAPPRRVHGSFCGLLDQRALREATANFRRLDTNGDGKPSLQEFRHGLGLLGLSPSFATILFNAFVMMTLFNEINARKLKGRPRQPASRRLRGMLARH